jgi:hypothetical protein
LPFISLAAHVALAALTALGWLGAGSALLARLPRSGDVLLDALNRLGVGAIGFALVTFGAGLAGLLYRWLYVPALVVCAFVGLVTLRRILPALPRPNLTVWPWWQRALAASIAVAVLLVVVATGAPVTAFDALHYHASAPARYVEAHRVLEIDWSWSSYQPFTVEMLVTDGGLLWDSIQGAFAPLTLALATLVAVIGMGLRVGSRGLALLAGGAFFLQPLIALEASGTLIESGLAFAVALAAWNIAVYARGGAVPFVALAGFFAGAAAGMKYVGLFVPIAALVALVLAARPRLSPSALAAFAVPAALVALPWYVKNAVETGNPIYPFVFGGVNEDARRWIDEAIHEHGEGRTPIDALLLPFRLVAQGNDFDRGSWLSPLVVIFPVLSLLDATRRRWCIPALAGALVYLAAWFATSQQARFLLPLAPVLSILAAIGIFALAAKGRAGRLVAGAAAGAAFLTGFAMSAVYTAQFAPVALGLEDREHFLSAKTAYFDGVERLNAMLDDDDKVLLDFAGVLYVEDPYVVWTPIVLPTPAPVAETRRFARENGLTHAAVLEVNLAARSAQLRALGARELTVVDVQAPVFGLRIQRGQPELLHVYELGG